MIDSNALADTQLRHHQTFQICFHWSFQFCSCGKIAPGL